MKHLFWILCSGWFCLPLSAQKDQYRDWYPGQPLFSLVKASELGKNKASVWVDHYKRGEHDESGLQWSEALGLSYQKELYIFFDGDLQSAIWYDSTEQARQKWQYHYKQGLVSAVEYSDYAWIKDRRTQDSAWGPVLQYIWAYTYQQGRRPFQRVQVWEGCGNCRVLHDYLWDSLGRIKRERQSASGFPSKGLSVEQPKAKKKDGALPVVEQKIPPAPPERMILTEYDESSIYRRTYLGLHELERSEEWVLGEDGQPLVKKIFIWKDEKKSLWESVNYTYSDGRLVKEEYNAWVEEGKWGIAKRRYYEYSEEGLLAKLLVEEGDLQRIYNFTYTE